MPGSAGGPPVSGPSLSCQRRQQRLEVRKDQVVPIAVVIQLDLVDQSTVVAHET